MQTREQVGVRFGGGVEVGGGRGQRFKEPRAPLVVNPQARRLEIRLKLAVMDFRGRDHKFNKGCDRLWGKL